jgi:hypothetical protein
MRIAELLQPPFRDFVIESPLAREVAVRELGKAVVPRRYFRMSKPEQPFEGEVRADGFRLFRIIRYRNSFLPLIVGRFENAPYGSHVRITMRPIWLVVAVWIAWMGFAIFAAILGLFAPPRGAGDSRALALAVVAGLVSFGYLLASIAFGIEARKARVLLTGILTGSGAAKESAAERG